MRSLFVISSLIFIILPFQANALKSKDSIKLGLGQYRIFDAADSHSFTPISIQYSARSYKTKLLLPYINGYRGESGLGNAVIKLSYLTRWNNIFIDLHLRQKFATANEKLTLPVNDRGGSIGLSRYISKGIIFAELGHVWRSSETASNKDRDDSFYYTLGGIYSLQKGMSSGIVFDHRITALGRLDHIVTGFVQYKWDANTRLGGSLGKGLKEISPDWIAGLSWSRRY